jgi:hypothetical protein
MTFDIDKEIEEAKLRFRIWLNMRVERELEMMNFKHMWDYHGMIYVNNKFKGYVGVDPYPEIVWKDMKSIGKSPYYIIGCDPYDEISEKHVNVWKDKRMND